MNFKCLGLHDSSISTLKTLSIVNPTKIQEVCIPKIFEGKDILASAKTGSGKTAAFALPILQHLSTDPYGTFSLILTPTRELAFQIAEQMKAFGQNARTSVEVIVGGIDMMQQAKAANNRPHILVATPGRLADLITSSSDCIHFRKLRYLVLDEADRLLEATFSEHLQIIFDFVEKNDKIRPQVLLFSATLTRDLSLMLQKGPSKEAPGNAGSLVFSDFLKMKDPFVFHADEDFETVSNLVQKYLFVPSQVRETYLVYLLRIHFAALKSLIIFTGKCKTAELLRLMFRELDIRSTALHSNMSQRERLASIAKFKSNIVPILITTDVGSRGLDIPTVQCVINYDVPADAKDYIHRIGRTARAGRGGLALTIMCEMDIDLVLSIEKVVGKKLLDFQMPEDNFAESNSTKSADSAVERNGHAKSFQSDLLKEKDVLVLLTEVSTAKRVASIALSESLSQSKRLVNKQKVKRAKLSTE